MTYRDLTEDQLLVLLSTYEERTNGHCSEGEFDGWSMEDFQSNFELDDKVSENDLEILLEAGIRPQPAAAHTVIKPMEF
jgi:hypothetical protein